METHHDKIREAVRAAYTKVAKASETLSETSLAAPCCGPSDNSTETKPGSSCGCGGPDVSLEQRSAAIGYSKAEMDSAVKQT